jgi:hypothetical protein
VDVRVGAVRQSVSRCAGGKTLDALAAREAKENLQERKAETEQRMRELENELLHLTTAAALAAETTRIRQQYDILLHATRVKQKYIDFSNIANTPKTRRQARRLTQCAIEDAGNDQMLIRTPLRTLKKRKLQEVAGIEADIVEAVETDNQ